MVQARNIARWEAVRREARANGGARIVQDGLEDGVRCVRLPDLVAHVPVPSDARPTAVDDEDLARGQEDRVGHDTRRGHLLRPPARGDPCIREYHPRTLRRGRVIGVHFVAFEFVSEMLEPPQRRISGS